MKIYVGHSKELNFKDELYLPLRESQLNSVHEIILPHEIYQEAGDFTTKNIIKTCDVMIAEVSFPTTGMGIELGWANSFGIPIICIYRKGSKISGSLKVVCKNFVEYTVESDMIAKINDALAKLRD
jgi:nucleoside 2-deoxyribosyltransferase